MSTPDFSGDLLESIWALEAREPAPRASAPDPDDLDRVLGNLSIRHGDLEVSEPDSRGTVRITAASGQSWRYTNQSILIAERKSR